MNPEQEINGPHCIEGLILGTWETLDMAENLEEAITLASSLVHEPCHHVSRVSDARVRISTPDNRIL